MRDAFRLFLRRPLPFTGMFVAFLLVALLATLVPVAGSVLMLLIAGFVEGVFRQVVQSVPMRYTLAVVFAIAWSAYFGFAGRRRA